MDCPPHIRTVCLVTPLATWHFHTCSRILREDRTLLHIPKSFADLKDLNYLLKKYRDIYPFRVFLSYVLTYFLSVPFLVLLRSRSDHPS